MKQVWTDTLEIAVEHTEGHPCLRLQGEGEAEGAGRLIEIVEHLLAEGHTHVILDTRGLRFLDPDSAAALEAVVERLEGEGGALLIVDCCAPVERALKLLGVEQRAHVVPTLEQAVYCLDS